MTDVLMRGIQRDDFYEIFLEDKDHHPIVRGSNPSKAVALKEMRRYAEEHHINIVKEINT